MCSGPGKRQEVTLFLPSTYPGLVSHFPVAGESQTWRSFSNVKVTLITERVRINSGILCAASRRVGS